jgi:putative acetyltransferase
MRKARHPFVVGLGHPGYYPLFGFVRASQYGITSQYEGVPDEAFMIQVFEKAELKGISGAARYRAEFDSAI